MIPSDLQPRSPPYFRKFEVVADLGCLQSVRPTGKLDSVLLTGVLRGAVVFSWSHGAGCRGLSKSYSSKTVSATRRSVRSAPLDLSRSISPRTASRSLNCGEDKSTRLQIFDPGIQELLKHMDNVALLSSLKDAILVRFGAHVL